MQIPGLPTLPTDSYYKFRALAGIWLIAGAIAGVGLAFFKFAHDLHDFEMRDAILKIETNLFWQRGRDSNRLAHELSQETSEDLDNIGPAGLSPEQEARFLERERRTEEKLALLKKHAKEFSEFATAVQKEASQVSVARRYMLFAGGGLVVLTLIAVAMCICGVRIARAGFAEWRELQQLQDAFLRRQWSEPVSGDGGTSDS